MKAELKAASRKKTWLRSIVDITIRKGQNLTVMKKESESVKRESK